MRLLRALLCAAILCQIALNAMAQEPPEKSSVPVFRSTTTLVFLDVTVLEGSPRLGGQVVSCRRPQPFVLAGLHELVLGVHGQFPSWSTGHGW